ncbi:cation transporter [Marinilabilia rubra]|uniref:HMA domain-containing protein n=1 Tax=Marinilabilia rubra TaxID=2162893 RepID=A0A2U2B9Y5_9BACT|nr:cation transporter [Marinilabilia rubra]PWD99878.1 hypothetical protein DDZ16_08280 [Marinilabilia rubra]
MKYLLLLSLILVFSCRNTNTQKQDAKNNETNSVEMAPENAMKFIVTIEGMTCTGCEQTIQNSVKTVDGVINIKANHKKGMASITTDPGQTDTTLIKQKIEEAGYHITSISQKN